MVSRETLASLETIVIASIIHEPHLLKTLGAKPGHFYYEANKSIIDAFLRTGISIEIAISACSKLVADAKNYVIDMVESVVSTSGTEANMALIKEEAMRRELISHGKLFIESLEGGNTPIESAGDIARAVTKIAAEDSVSTMGSVHTMAEDLLAFDGDSARAIDLGFDGLVGKRGQLIVPAARPGCGKSALALQICQHVALTGPVMYFCGEMSRKEVWLRAMSQYYHRPITPDITNFKAVAAKYNAWAVDNIDLHLDDKDCIDIDELVAKATAQHYQTPLKMICVDYLQKVKCSYMKTRFEQVSEVVIRLKKLARDLDVLVIAPAQLKREGSERPLLSHLRDTGQIEQEADQVWLMSSAETHDPIVVINLEIAKHRGGPTGDIAVEFNKPSYTLRRTL